MTPESTLKGRVVQIARRQGWRVFSLPAIRNLRPVKQAEGYPDLTLARDGAVKWIELKSLKGTLSAAQAAWILELPKVDVLYEDATDWDIERLLA